MIRADREEERERARRLRPNKSSQRERRPSSATRTSANNKSRVSAPALPGVPSGSDSLEETRGSDSSRLKRRTTRISATGDAPPPFTECSLARSLGSSSTTCIRRRDSAADSACHSRAAAAGGAAVARSEDASWTTDRGRDPPGPVARTRKESRLRPFGATMLMARARAERMRARYLALHRAAYHGRGAITRPELHTYVGALRGSASVSPRAACICRRVRSENMRLALSEANEMQNISRVSSESLQLFRKTSQPLRRERYLRILSPRSLIRGLFSVRAYAHDVSRLSIDRRAPSSTKWRSRIRSGFA